MRRAARAGWYSALGITDVAERHRHDAYAEWAKEMSLGRRFSFSDMYNDDLYNKIDFVKLKELTDKYLKDLNNEIKKAKKK